MPQVHKNIDSTPVIFKYEFYEDFHPPGKSIFIQAPIMWDLMWSLDGITWTIWSEYLEDPEDRPYQQADVAVPVNRFPKDIIFRVIPKELIPPGAQVLVCN